jgi:hypothetical protein
VNSRRTLRRLRRRVLPGLRHLHHSQVRRCACCDRPTVMVALSAGDEFTRCVLCGANFRFELLARWIREHWPELGESDVLELDATSPLRPILSKARTYIPTYYPGSPAARASGARPEDITALSMPDASVDLIVSSEVLEHVPDLAAAFSETERVLRPNGMHVFTVPPRRVTFRRAEKAPDGTTTFHAPPEWHADPWDERGILVYWDIGIDDAGELFSTDSLEVSVLTGPAGKDGRVVWGARRLATG